VRDARLLVPRRVRRVETNQVTQELDWIDHGSRGPYRVVSPGRAA
jgi:hypothetical protein